MFRYRKILVPLDGSELAEQAVPTAMALAELMSAEVQCVQAVTGYPFPLDAEANEEVIRAREQAAQQYLEAVEHRYATSGTTIHTEVIHGPAARAIIDHAYQDESDLIVISSHGGTGLARWVYGNVVAKVLRRGPSDVLLVRSFASIAPFSTNRVLVPLDGSARAERALDLATSIASVRSSKVLLLRVVPAIYKELEPMFAASMYEKIERKAMQEAQGYLDDLQAALQAKGVSVQVDALVGPEAATIVDYAGEHQVDLIVMSSHGRSGAELWLLGSVSEKVLRQAKCSTLLVRVPSS